LELRKGFFVAEFARIPLGSQREIVGILANFATTIRNAQLKASKRGWQVVPSLAFRTSIYP
jgi:hypothetical protein